MIRNHAILFSVLVIVLCLGAGAGRAAAVLGPPPLLPMTFPNCPDKAAMMQAAKSIPPRLWPRGMSWVVQEYDEKAWKGTCILFSSLSSPKETIDPATTDGLTVFGDMGMGIVSKPVHFVFIRRSPAGGTPLRNFWHELGHIIWISLVSDPNVRGGQAYFEQMVDFYGSGKDQSFSPGTSVAEEAFATAFEANRFDRASAENDWGQHYIDGIMHVWDGDEEDLSTQGPPEINKATVPKSVSATATKKGG